jgi:hypothetical protein
MVFPESPRSETPGRAAAPGLSIQKYTYFRTSPANVAKTVSKSSKSLEKRLACGISFLGFCPSQRHPKPRKLFASLSSLLALLVTHLNRIYLCILNRDR